mmetsp:Transcript_25615/g.55459  ORF Transcript_25615/g.55459 Transcript_25615/m.55459 type:complete len:560 (+) Transcript_25615:199-1878(+)
MSSPSSNKDPSSTKPDRFAFIPLPVKDWSYTIAIGFFVASYWRGTWTLLDIWLCGQPDDATLAEDGNTFCFMVEALADTSAYYGQLRLQSARTCYGIGIALLFVGVVLVWSGAWLPRLTATPDGTAVPGKVTPSLAIVRFVILYVLGASAVCIWRGIWYWADDWILVTQPLASFWTTSLVGSTVAFLLGAGASLLAPPAIFLLDGPAPGGSPPPVAVTILSSYYSVTLPADEKPPKLKLYVRIADVVISFIFLPFCVVWYWRGSWLVLDNYLWGFTTDRQDVNVSLGWGILLSAVCVGLTSEPFVCLIDRRFDLDTDSSSSSTNTTRRILWALGSLRTWVLAWGTVSYWRVVWYIWDQFLPGPTYWSCWLSHALGVVCLTVMGCMACIVAPASTIGVDAVPHPKCADEPLFSMAPVPYDALYFMGIGRQEWARKSKKGEEEEDEKKAEEEDGDVELTPQEKAMDDEEEGGEEGEDKKEPPAPAPAVTITSTTTTTVTATVGSRRNMLQTVASRRLGPDGSVVSYMELQRPGLGARTCSEYSQRPGMGNKRGRSKLFRSR